MNGVYAVSLLEVAPLQPHVSISSVRDLLRELNVPLTVVGELRTRSALLIEVDSLRVEEICRMLRPYSTLDVVELRRHFRMEYLTRDRLSDLVAESRRTQRLAVGAAAVERAMQRRRLELLIAATKLNDTYEKMVRAVVERNGYLGPLVASDLTHLELGQAAGVRRAGCVGLIRGSRHVSL